MNEPRKSRLVAGVVIVLVFLAGVAVGFFLHHAMPRRGSPGLAMGGPPPGPPPADEGLDARAPGPGARADARRSTPGSTRSSPGARPTSGR